MDTTEVLVVGGSVAGLQAALTLGRARRRVVLVDDGRPRNAPARHVQNFLGAPAPSPAELLAAGRAMLAPYDVTVVADRVEDVRSVDGRFEAVTGAGVRWSARAVVLATGLDDELPAVPGVADSWGDRVVACPHCHGWEVRDTPVAQLGMRGLPARGVERALLLRGWSEDVVLCTDGDTPADGDAARLGAAGVEIRTERVLRVVPAGDGVDVVLRGGDVLRRRALFTVTRQHQQTDLAARLGCRTAGDGPAVEADATGRTTVPGVWAAGTTAVPSLLAVGAAGHGSTVATALHAVLAAEDR
ncbi:MAG TPA: NAD(P)/FAD-dependent oxidoreductase [Mycobacteriales bacterium]|jgi:thioredoxin reductase (NADPH)